MNGKRTATYWLTATIVRLFMLGAAAVSFSHIIATSHALGLGWEAWTVPFLVDGLAVLGMIGRSAKFAASTQRAGLRLMVGAGLLSLACNVYAGHNLGQRLYGVLIVAGFVVSEWYAAKLRPAPLQPTGPTDEEIAAAEAKAAEAAKRSRAAKKAARTRKANAARKAEVDAIEISVAEAERAFQASVAPVSPALPTTYL